MNSFIKREYDYAIRICAYLAGRDSKKPISVPTIAKTLFISKPFTTKIVHKLKTGGITGSVQGKSGGIFLKMNPEKLSIMSILKVMHFNSTLNECIHDHRSCPLVKMCHIHNFFLDTERELIKTFKNKMISELAIRDQDLAPCLL